MTSPLSGPQYGFVWDNYNNGQVAPGSVIVATGSLNSSTTIFAVSSAVTVTKGQYVTGTGVPTPDFIATTTAAATTLNLITATTTTTATATITVQNFPVLLGGEFSVGLTAGVALTSSYWNNTGAVRPADTNQALFADIYFMSGGSFTPTTGSSLTGWFLRSFDGGSTFESTPATANTTIAAVSRAPDFIIPLDAAAYVAGNVRVAPQIALPSGTFKTIIQNNGSTVVSAKSAIFAVPITPAY